MTSFLLRVETEYMRYWVKRDFDKNKVLYICEHCFTRGSITPYPLSIMLPWAGKQEQGRERKFPEEPRRLTSFRCEEWKRREWGGQGGM